MISVRLDAHTHTHAHTRAHHSSLFYALNRESKLTCILREALANINCRVSIVAHVSNHINNYADTLTTVQMASRIHRVLRKKNKVTMTLVAP